MKTSFRITFIFGIIFLLMFHSNIYACSTCYGNPDSPASEGINYAIITLLGITGGVLGMIVQAIYSIGNKTKNYNKNFKSEDKSW
ncbi:MAG: hypothetical protein CMG62_04590 [Candidatus Marinimicrobia bacterium]|nr:hypothetical protein [Candidatus Neomarinimicrobiota bacterium]